MDFGQRGVILTLGEVRSFIRKPYKHCYPYNTQSMKIVNVNGFEEFLELGKRDWHPIHRWVYRGVSNAEYGLRPVLGRTPRLREGEVDTFDILNKERILLENFKRHAPAYTNKSPVGDLDWFCLARHYGLATRLLDWTENPLVALFFAGNPEHSKEFAVYRYWFSSWLGEKHTMDLKTIQKQKESLIFYPRLTTDRFVRQSSVFLLCHKPWEDFDGAPYPENLTKFVFPAEARNHVRYRLKIFGVTPSFVRPDLDGLCEELNDRILYRKKFWFPAAALQGPNPLRDLFEQEEETKTREAKRVGSKDTKRKSERLTKRSTRTRKKPRAG